MSTNTLPELEKGIKIEGEARVALTADLIKEYEAGTSVREISIRIGRSYGFVHRLLSEATTLRPRGGPRTKKVNS